MLYSSIILVYKNINSLLYCSKGSKCWEREREREREKERQTKTDEGLWLLTSYLLNRHCDSIFRAPLITSSASQLGWVGVTGCTPTPPGSTRWLLSKSVRISAHICIVTTNHCIIFSRPHIFLPVLNSHNLFPPSSCLHRWNILFRKSTMTCCQRSICNIKT